MRLLVWLALTSVLAISASADQNETSNKKDKASEADVVNVVHTILIDEFINADSFNLISAGEVEYGKRLAVTALIDNQSGKNLELLDHRTSCGCMKVDMPHRLIKSGETATLRIEFPVEGKSLTSISQQLRIKCQGAVDSIGIVVQAVPKDMVIFAYSEYTFVVPVDTDERTSKFEAALSTKDIGLLKTIQFSPSESSAILSVKALVRDGKPVAEVVLDNAKLTPANLTGTMELNSKVSAYRDVVSYRIVKQSRVQIHPETIVLSSNGNKKSVYSGRGLAKLASPRKQDVEKVSVSNASAAKEDNIPGVRIGYNKIKDTIGEITFEYDAAESAVPSKTTPYNVSFRLSDGSEVLVPVLLQFQ